MAYNPFYWWRRFSKPAPLKRKDAFKGKSFLLQQIEHGDFDYSDYSRQAQDEYRIGAERIEKLKKTFRGGPEALKEEIEKYNRMMHIRINRLMEDHQNEETKLLFLLRDKLLKEFDCDVWYEALKITEEGTMVDLYWNYQKLAEKVKNGESKCRSTTEVSN